jgi:hypothetical protein
MAAMPTMRDNPTRGRLLAILLAVLGGVNAVAAQKKIYVITDLEGISGVYQFAQTRENQTPLAWIFA